MVLESLEPKENDKILKTKIFLHFWGFRAPLKPPETLKRGFLGGPDTPRNEETFF